MPKQITELTAADPAIDDLLLFRDVSDTTDGAGGSSRKATYQGMRKVFGSKAAAVAYITANGVRDGDAYFITSLDGGTFVGVTGAAALTYADDGGSYCGTQFIPTGGDGSAGIVRKDSGILNILWYGAVAGAESTTAIQAAYARAAITKGAVYFPGAASAYICTSDITITSNDVLTLGDGRGSILELQAAKIYVDAETAGTHIYGVNFENIYINRTGTAGPAIHMRGKNGMGVARWSAKGLYVTSTGVGLQTAGTWLFDLMGCFITGCGSHGWQIELASDGNSSVNGGNVLGCEIQGNTGWGIYAEGVSVLSFLGTSIEGNAAGGVNLRNNCRTVGFWGCYFELNGSAAGLRDLVAGDTTYAGTKVTGYSLVIDGCVFWDGSGAAKNYAVELSRMNHVAVRNCAFNAYATGGINNNPEAASTVSGLYEACVSTVGSVCADSIYFKKRLEDAILKGSAILDFASIASGAQSVLTITVTGASPGDFCQVGAAVNLQGMTISAMCRIANTVEITIANNTAGAIDLAAATFRVLVTPYVHFF